MNIVGFAEGATARKGGLGLVGVPPILNSAAVLGNNVVLVMSSPPIPTANKYLDKPTTSSRRELRARFYPSWSNWGFSPLLLLRSWQLVKNADFVNLHSLYSFPVLAGYLLSRIHRKPYGVWPLGVLAPFQRSVSARKKWIYDKLIARRILDRAAVIFYTAEGERAEAAELRLATPSVVIPHGIDVDDFAHLPPRGAFRARYLNGHTGPLVLFLARINSKKGLDLLVEAMKIVVARQPKAALAIVGPPDPASFGERLRDWISASGVASNIFLTGPIGPETRLEALADADVFTLPSHAENFGFSMFEAMASGVPVVVSDTLNYSGEIAGFGAGIVVTRNPESLADGILRLLSDSQLRKQMGKQGIHLASRYSWTRVGEQVEAVIKNILGNRGNPEPSATGHIESAGDEERSVSYRQS